MLAIMQPYFFPYIGYFQLIHAVDKYVLYDNINYIKNGWVNRNRLLEVHRQPVYITVPLIRQTSFQKMKEVEIDNTKPWRKQLLNMLYYNYRRSAYYDETYVFIEDIMNKSIYESSLSKLNCTLIKAICNYLDIKTSVNDNSEMYEKIEMVIGEMEEAGDSCGIGRRTARIVEICRYEKAKIYINAIGGMELYSKEVFAKEGIELYFLKTLPYSYMQSTRKFHQHLSIIDVLMNCGKEETKRMLDKYEFI